MKFRLQKLLSDLAPYRDVLVFVVTLFAADAVWKLMVSGDESANTIAVCGVDLSRQFFVLESHITDCVEWIVSLWRDDLVRTNENTLLWETGGGSRIVWSCTPVKQSFIWLCLMLTTAGGWWHKMWYIPVGWLLMYGFNILRIVCATMVVAEHPEYFVLAHEYILKYLFYGFMFLMWVLFVEKIRN